MKKLNITIPMSGAGKRFQEAGFSYPKPLIDVNGKTMITRVIENLTPKNIEDYRFIFIVQEEHYNKFDLENVLKRAVGDKEVIIVKTKGMTAGAACTVLLASDYIDNDESLLIANSDQLIEEEGIEKWFSDIKNTKSDGLIQVFLSGGHPKWSYVRLDSFNNVLEVAEKRVISEWATTGLYYFSKGFDFVSGVKAMIEKDIRTNNEFYIAPVYNELVLRKKNIQVSEIKPEYMMGLGDPESLNNYLTNYKNG